MYTECVRDKMHAYLPACLPACLFNASLLDETITSQVGACSLFQVNYTTAAIF
jgi:hypothetical protein